MAESTDNVIITSDATKDSGFKMPALKIKTVLLPDFFVPVFFAFFRTNAKSLIFLLFAVVFATMSAVVVFWSFTQIEAAAVARQRAQLIIQKANLLTSSIKDAETSMRGYLLTNNIAFLQPYSTVINPIKLQLKQLQELNLSKLEQQLLNSLLPLIEAKLEFMARAVALQRNNNQTEAIALIKSAEGLKLMEESLLVLQQFIMSQETSLLHYEARFQSTMQRFFKIITVGSIFTLLFALVFAYFYYREVNQKIKNIVHAKTQHLLKTQETISDQLQRANNVLEDNEEKLAVTLNSIGDAVISTDIFSRVMRLNKVAEALTGWTLNEAIARPIDEIFNIINAQSREPVASPIFEAIADAKVQYLPKNTLLISRNGKEYNIADTCAPIFNFDNVVQGAVLVFRNVTEQEAIQTKLRASEELYRDTFEHASIGIAHVAVTGQFERVNDCFCKIAGYSAAELMKLTFQEITHPEDLDKDQAQFNQMLSGDINHYCMEKRYIHKDQSCVWIELSVSCIRKATGEVDYFIALAENITKRIQAAADSRRFFSLSQELLCIASFDGYFVEINDGWEEVLGYTRQELLTTNYLEFVHVDDRENTQREMLKLVQGGSLPNFENRYICKDGSTRYLLWSITADNVSKQLYASARDMTYLKQAEDARLSYTAELKEAKAVAEKANAAKSEFLSSMSHELRTPLNAILGFAQLIESGNPAPTPSQQRSLQQILHGGWYLLELINEILDLALIESGKQPLSLEPVLLNDIMRECAMLIEPLAIKNSISVTFSPITPYTYVLADKTRLKQVLINLLSNAIKYNKKDGLVSVDCSRKNETIKISVRDTGIGLDDAQLTQLYEPFNRLGKTATGEEGTGIGLMVSKKLVELMQGNIGVRSTVNQGSVFWITLNLVETPALLNEQTQLPALNHDEVLAHQTQSFVSSETEANLLVDKLLYIEDNQANFMLVEEMITLKADITLQGAVDGAQGLEMANTWQPQVILLDINLPDMSGYAVLKALAKNPATAHIPVIAISANAMQADIQKGIEAGFFRYLTKPIKLIELMDALTFAFKYTKINQLNND